MTTQITADQAAREAFRALQARARAEHGGNTQLMTASGIWQMTKDADLSTHGIAGEEGRVREIVAQISALAPDPHDGVQTDPATIRTELMREQDEYQGVRCKLIAGLGHSLRCRDQHPGSRFRRPLGRQPNPSHRRARASRARDRRRCEP